MTSTNGDGECKDTLSLASLHDGSAVAIGLSSRIIFASFCTTCKEVLTVDDGQVVRSVCFMQSPGAATYIISGGDGKKINVYGVPLRKAALDAESCDSPTREEGLSLLFSFGPHAKRITHVAACDSSTILFADKFGEVYRLGLEYGPDHSLLSASGKTSASVFLMQHFSVITTLFLSAPIAQLGWGDASTQVKEERDMSGADKERRLFTFDRDRHARVSFYPDTFRIEQFLWTEAPQSAVTSIAEISVSKKGCEHAYFVTGCYDGKVHLWVADNSLEGRNSTEPFTHCGSFAAQQVGVAKDEEVASVASVVHLTASLPSSSSSGGPDADADKSILSGVLIAYACKEEVIFVPLKNRDDNHTLSFDEEGATLVPLGTSPLGAVQLGADAVFLLGRDGRPRRLRLLVDAAGRGRVVCGAGEEGGGWAALGDVVAGGAQGLLSEMDLFALWNYNISSPHVGGKSATSWAEEEEEEEEDKKDNNNNSNNCGEEEGENNATVKNGKAGRKRMRIV